MQLCMVSELSASCDYNSLNRSVDNRIILFFNHRWGKILDHTTISFPSAPEINFAEFLISFGFCIAASFLLKHVYVWKSISLSGKYHIGTTIPILSCVTFLVIMVIKSSLALSLGLVGALSVIRFRTPIKEPEELVYLFLAIAIGLGYGANQIFVTTTVFVVTLILILFWLSRKGVVNETEFNLHIDWTNAQLQSDKTLNVDDVVNRLSDHVSNIELQKFSSGPNEKSMFIKVSINKLSDIQMISEKLTDMSDGIECSFYEARPLQ